MAVEELGNNFNDKMSLNYYLRLIQKYVVEKLLMIGPKEDNEGWGYIMKAKNK